MKQNKFSLVSLETIGYQINDSFPKEIEALLKEFKEKQNAKKLEKGLENAIKNRLNMSTKIKIDSVPGIACIECSVSEMSNILTSAIDWGDPYVKQNKQYSTALQLLKGDLSKTGLIDNKKGKLSGFLSKITQPIWLDKDSILESETDEFAAILLHEIGHAWTVMEVCGLTVMRNAVLADYINDYFKMSDDVKRKELIIAQNNSLGLKVPENVSELDNEKATAVIMGAFNNEVLAHDIGYQYKHCEVMADQFVTRFGYSEPLARAIDKYNKLWSLGIDQNTNQAIMAAIVLASACWGAITAAITIPAAALATLGYFGFNLLISGASGYPYEDNITRIRQMRSGLIDYIKVAKDPKEVKRSLEQIEKIQKIIDGTKGSTDFYDNIATVLFSQKRKEQKEREIENLINNELFVLGAEFQNLK